MKKVLLCTAVMLAVSLPSFAESVFLKDGSIIEGRITSETNTDMTLTAPDGKTTIVPRADIIRTAINDEYKKQMWVYTMNDTFFACYIVDETDTALIYRTKLDSAAELSIPRADVNIVAAEKVDLAIISKKEAEKRAKWKPWYINIYSGITVIDTYSHWAQTSPSYDFGSATTVSLGLRAFNSYDSLISFGGLFQWDAIWNAEKKDAAMAINHVEDVFYSSYKVGATAGINLPVLWGWVVLSPWAGAGGMVTTISTWYTAPYVAPGESGDNICVISADAGPFVAAGGMVSIRNPFGPRMNFLTAGYSYFWTFGTVKPTDNVYTVSVGMSF